MTPFQANLSYTPSFLPDLQGYFCSQSVAKLATAIKETQTQLVAHPQSAVLDYKKHYCQGSGCTSTLAMVITPNIQSLPNLVPF
ncbi:hypothetical protein DSO57_1020631 [Entomophthora muscae]|uniref:Uncharacterized protein n=1 Tax=Entomophthora muscae TaxID=34485 RepID=A0ACC2S5R3_9FUNG|nr:hypothetical protein DSO57_1020631 [Entomophthora muscae]